MMNENEKQIPVSEDFLPEEPPLAQELPPEELPAADMPELILVPGESVSETEETPVMPESFLLFPESEAETGEESPLEEAPRELPAGEEEDLSLEIPDEIFEAEDAGTEPMEDTAELPIEVILAELQHDREAGLIPPAEDLSDYPPIDEPYIDEPPAEQLQEPRYHAPRKGRPRRKGGYGLFGLPHLAATLVWLGIIVMIGTSLGRMAWVCAADVLAFGRESKQVSVTITSRDTIDDIAAKLHEADLIRYPQVFKLYAKLAVDEGDILPGTFQLDTIYDYHALVVQMGPRSSTRSVVEDLLIPEGLNCRQIFELLEQKNICTVRELEEYAATGEFSEFWFLDGLERGDRYCLEGFLFPDTYDFYEHSTPREALGKMLLARRSSMARQD